MSWVPAPGELYYYIILDQHAFITADIAIMEGFTDTLGRITIGNCFQTHAQAERALKRLIDALNMPMPSLVED